MDFIKFLSDMQVIAGFEIPVAVGWTAWNKLRETGQWQGPREARNDPEFQERFLNMVENEMNNYVRMSVSKLASLSRIINELNDDCEDMAEILEKIIYGIDVHKVISVEDFEKILGLVNKYSE